MVSNQTQSLLHGSLAGSAVGVTASVIGADGVLAMGALGGCFFFLAVTDKMTTSFRIFSVLGALIFGFLAGWAIAPLLDNIVLAAMCACGISALISWFIGSLARWADGGLTHARPPM